MRKALIVDDSKTARHALCLLLERIGFDVDMLESAEEALEYLQEQMPDLVFMDHLMPGMDGFQAVKVIKSNARIAAIPIIMYTARDGEVYFGQAHALGAADILTKPARAADLNAVLARLEEKSPAPEPVDAVVEVRPVDEPFLSPPPAAVVEPSPPSDGTIPPPGVDRDPLYEAPLYEAPRYEAPLYEAPGDRRRSPFWPVVLVMLMLVPAVWLLSLYLPAEQQRQQLLERERQLYRTLEWALNQSGHYPWGEPAMAGPRLERLQGLISQLSALGFEGQIRLKVHVGDFCLVGDGTGGWLTAPPDLPVTECGALGLPAASAMALSEYQGSAFSHFVEESPLLADDRIRIEWMGYGSSSPREDYPLHAEQMDAGSWNAIAARNQRVELELLPAGALRRDDPRTAGEPLISGNVPD